MSALTKEQIDALPGLLVDVPKQWLFAETVSDDGQEWFGCGVMIDGYEAVWLDNEAEKDTPACRLIALAPSLAATVIEQQAEIERLRAYVADFANTKFEQIENRGRNWRGPEDDEDPVTDWMAIDAWQDDARAVLEGNP